MKKWIFSFLILILIWSIFIEPNMLCIKKYGIKNKNLTGLKIAFIGDFHTKPRQEKQLKNIVEKVNKQNPDLILMTGDFVSGHQEESTLPIEIIVNNLSNLKAKYGIYTVLGNHDWWQNGEKITQALEDKNIKVLANSNLKITIKNSTLNIAGVEDLYTRTPNIEKALENTSNPIILLSHSPDILPKVPKKVDLTLAGHTHGGQIRLPFFGAIKTPSEFGNKYSQGLIKEDGKNMIVTKGIGTSILSIRFNCMPEIVIIEFE